MKRIKTAPPSFLFIKRWRNYFLLICLLAVWPVCQLSATASPMQQKIRVTGTVVDHSGESIPGVNVVEKGTMNGIITDIDGSYSLEISEGNSTLVFSFIGFSVQEVPVSGRRVINVTLQEESLDLEEVVVVGYGTQRKRDLTGAVSQVKATTLEKESPATVQDILRANIPGLNIGFTNSAQGGGDLQIRGKRSIKANNEPLLVVDGIIYYGSLAEINPNDIEQIDVLKDASSAAVYGAKSAAGVVLITTKKGTSEKPTIKFNASVGASMLGVKEDVYGPEEYLRWREDVQESIFIDHRPGEFSNPNNLPAGVTLEEWASYRPSTGNHTYDWLVRLGLFEPEIENYFAGRINQNEGYTGFELNIEPLSAVPESGISTI